MISYFYKANIRISSEDLRKFQVFRTDVPNKTKLLQTLLAKLGNLRKRTLCCVAE